MDLKPNESSLSEVTSLRCVVFHHLNYIMLGSGPQGSFEAKVKAWALLSQQSLFDSNR